MSDYIDLLLLNAMGVFGGLAFGFALWMILDRPTVTPLPFFVLGIIGMCIFATWA